MSCHSSDGVEACVIQTALGSCLASASLPGQPMRLNTSKLCLLLAGLHQFSSRGKLSTATVHGRPVCMADGHGVIVAMVCASQRRRSRQGKCDIGSAHMKALLVLRALQEAFAGELDAIVAADAARKEQMLEAYTARHIEGSAQQQGDDDGSAVDAATMAVFRSFQTRVLVPVLQLPSLAPILARSPPAQHDATALSPLVACSSPSTALLVRDSRGAHSGMAVVFPSSLPRVGALGLAAGEWTVAAQLAACMAGVVTVPDTGIPVPRCCVLCHVHQLPDAPTHHQRRHQHQHQPPQPCSVAVIRRVPGVGGVTVTGFRGVWSPTTDATGTAHAFASLPQARPRECFAKPLRRGDARVDSSTKAAHGTAGDAASTSQDSGERETSRAVRGSVFVWLTDAVLPPPVAQLGRDAVDRLTRLFTPTHHTEDGDAGSAAGVGVNVSALAGLYTATTTASSSTPPSRATTRPHAPVSKPARVRPRAPSRPAHGASSGSAGGAYVRPGTKFVSASGREYAARSVGGAPLSQPRHDKPQAASTPLPSRDAGGLVELTIETPRVGGDDDTTDGTHGGLAAMFRGKDLELAPSDVGTPPRRVAATKVDAVRASEATPVPTKPRRPRVPADGLATAIATPLRRRYKPAADQSPALVVGRPKHRHKTKAKTKTKTTRTLSQRDDTTVAVSTPPIVEAKRGAAIDGGGAAHTAVHGQVLSTPVATPAPSPSTRPPTSAVATASGVGSADVAGGLPPRRNLDDGLAHGVATPARRTPGLVRRLDGSTPVAHATGFLPSPGVDAGAWGGDVSTPLVLSVPVTPAGHTRRSQGDQNHGATFSLSATAPASAGAGAGAGAAGVTAASRSGSGAVASTTAAADGALPPMHTRPVHAAAMAKALPDSRRHTTADAATPMSSAGSVLTPGGIAPMMLRSGDHAGHTSGTQPSVARRQAVGTVARGGGVGSGSIATPLPARMLDFDGHGSGGVTPPAVRA